MYLLSWGPAHIPIAFNEYVCVCDLCVFSRHSSQSCFFTGVNIDVWGYDITKLLTGLVGELKLAYFKYLSSVNTKLSTHCRSLSPSTIFYLSDNIQLQYSLVNISQFTYKNCS